MFTKTDFPKELKNSEVIWIFKKRPSKEGEPQVYKLITKLLTISKTNYLNTSLVSENYMERSIR